MSLSNLIVANIIRFADQLHGLEVVGESQQQRDADTANTTRLEFPEVVDDRVANDAETVGGLASHTSKDEVPPPLNNPEERVRHCSHAARVRALSNLCYTSGSGELSITVKDREPLTRAQLVSCCSGAALQPADAVVKMSRIGLPGVATTACTSGYNDGQWRLSALDAIADAWDRCDGDALRSLLHSGEHSSAMTVVSAIASYCLREDADKRTDLEIPATAQLRRWAFEFSEPANQQKLSCQDALEFVCMALREPPAPFELIMEGGAEERAKLLIAATFFFAKRSADSSSLLSTCVFFVLLGDALRSAQTSPLRTHLAHALASDAGLLEALEELRCAVLKAAASEAPPSSEPKRRVEDAVILTIAPEAAEPGKTFKWQVPVTLGLSGYCGGTPTFAEIKLIDSQHPLQCTVSGVAINAADMTAEPSTATAGHGSATTFFHGASARERALAKDVHTLRRTAYESDGCASFSITEGPPKLLLLRGEGAATFTVTTRCELATMPPSWYGAAARCCAFLSMTLIQLRLRSLPRPHAAAGEAARSSEADVQGLTQQQQQQQLSREPSMEPNASGMLHRERSGHVTSGNSAAVRDTSVLEHAAAILLKSGLAGSPTATVERTDEAMKLISRHPEGDQLAQRMFASVKVQASAQSCARSVLAVLLCHVPAPVAIRELQQRWNIDWAPRLQGEANREVCRYLEKLCEFIVMKVEHPSANITAPDEFDNGSGTERVSNHVLRGLMALLLAHHPIADVEAELKRRHMVASLVPQAVEVLRAHLRAPSTACAAVAVAVSWLTPPDSDGVHYLDGLQGCGACVEKKIATSVVALIRSLVTGDDAASDDTMGGSWWRHLAAMKVLMHTFSTDDLALLMDPSVGVRALMRQLICDGLADDCSARMSACNNTCSNTFSTTRNGVQVVETPQGVLVDRTAMGTLCLRATTPWQVKWRQQQTLAYFEVTITSSDVVRVMLGLCTPQCEVEAFGSRSISEDACFLDSGASRAPRVYFGAKGDVVGCGLDASTETAFFTVNGALVLQQSLRCMKNFNSDWLYPFITYETTNRSSIVVNFGASAFVFPVPTTVMGLCRASAPSSTTLKTAVHQAAVAGWCAIHARVIARGSDTILDSMLRETMELLEALQGAGARGSFDAQISVLRTLSEVPTADQRFTGKRARVLAEGMIRLHRSCKKEVEPLILGVLEATIMRQPHCMPKASTLELLQRFKETGNDTDQGVVPFFPTWAHVNEELSYGNAQIVKVTDEHKFTHALGTVLPPVGVTTFSIFITHPQSATPAVTMLGQFYVGVSAAPIGVLASGSWKTASPPAVWALHSDLTSQLSHADEAALGNDPFVFSKGSVVTVTVDRDRGTVSFQRGTTTFDRVFVDVPHDVELRPFVQVVGESACAVIIPGTRTSAITPAAVAYGARASLLRTMLCLPMSAALVAASVSEELVGTSASTAAVPWRALAILGTIGDPRGVLLRHARGECAVRVECVSGGSASVRTRAGDHLSLIPLVDLFPAATAALNFAPLQLHDDDDPFEPPEDSDDDDGGAFDQDGMPQPRRTTEGARMCVSAVASFISRWGNVTVQRSLLLSEEVEQRIATERDEAVAFTRMTAPHREHQFELLARRNASLMTSVLQAPATPQTYTFNRRDTSPGISIPAHYEGKLALATMETNNKVTMPLVAIANEAIPRSGIVNVRIKIEADWMGLLPSPPGAIRRLPPGYYFGVCLGSYHGSKRQHSRVSPPDMWAATSIDNEEYHLPHSCQNPKGIWYFFDKDTLRLQIDRKAGTLTLFRTSRSGREACMGVLFDNVPPDADLYPFVQLPMPRAAALFLPEAAALPRREENDPRFAHKVGRAQHNCDGCLSQLVDTKVVEPDWFRCNQCADYDLCRQCFINHCHCGHTFTNMRRTSFIVSPVTSASGVLRNAAVEVAAVPVTLLVAENMIADEQRFRCEVVTTTTASAGITAKAVWGLLRRAGASSACEITVSFRAHGPNAHADSILVGLGTMTAVMGKSKNEILDAANSDAASSTSSPDLVLLASSELDDPMSSRVVAPVSRQSSRGFSIDDTLSFTLTGGSLVVCKNGSCVRTTDLTSWGNEASCLFCFIDGQDIGVSLLRTGNEFVSGKIGEVAGAQKAVRVTTGASNRWCAFSDVRTPITAAKGHFVLSLGQRVFVVRPSLGSFVPCVVMALGAADEPVTVHDGATSFAASIDCIFVPENDNVAKESDNESCLFPEVKARMRRFYAKYVPDKSEADMDKAISLYARAKGGHDAMFEALVKKYGPEPQMEPPAPPQKRDSRETVGDVSAIEGFVATRLLHFLSTAASCGSKTAAAADLIDADAAACMAPSLATLASLAREAKLLQCGTSVEELLVMTSRCGQGRVKGFNLTPERDLSRHLSVGDCVTMVFGPQSQGTSAWKILTISDAGTTATCVNVANEGETAVLPLWSLMRTATDPTNSAQAWFAAQDPVNAMWVSTMGEQAWRGRMTSPNGFGFDLTLDLSTSVASLSFTSYTAAPKGAATSAGAGGTASIRCCIEQVVVNKAQRALSFLLVGADNEAATKLLMDETQTFAAGARRRRCPRSSSSSNSSTGCVAVERVLSFSGVFCQDGTVSGEWILVSGSTGRAVLKPAGQVSFTPPCDVLLPNLVTHSVTRSSSAVGPPTTTAAEALVALLSTLSQRVQSVAMPRLCAPPAASTLLLQVLNTRGVKAQRELLRYAAGVGTECFCGLIARVADVCHRADISRAQAVAASQALSAALDVACPGVDLTAGPAYQELLRAAVAAVHQHLNSLALLQSLARIVACGASRHPASAVLLEPLRGLIERRAASGADDVRLASLAASIFVEVASTSPPPSAQRPSHRESLLPLQALAFLRDCASAVQSERSFPALADCGGGSDFSVSMRWDCLCKGTELRGSALGKGMVMASTEIAADGETYYFEVIQPATARLVVGVAVAEFRNHCVATEAFGHKAMIGSNALSFGYDGTQTIHNHRCARYGWSLVTAGDVLGCAVNTRLRTVRYSVNGEAFTEIALPHALRVDPLFAVVQATSNSGDAKLLTREEQLHHLPPTCVALEARTASFTEKYDSKSRSSLPPRNIEFYKALASWMDTPQSPLPAELGDVDASTALKYNQHVLTIEMAVLDCQRAIDLDAPTSSSIGGDATLRMFAVVKHLMRKSKRNDHLVTVAPLESRKHSRTLTQVSIRWFSLFPRKRRSPEAALQHSILGQLFRQVGRSRAVFEHTPMFTTALMMTDSGHVPIDAGGPYNQVWSLLSEEIMGSNERAAFQRNPLFVTIDNAHGKRVVPDAKRTSSVELAHLRFFGMIMGHMARAKTPLALELAPLVWKALVEQPLDVVDMYDGLEPFWQATVIENDDLLNSPQVTEFLPTFHDEYDALASSPTHMQRLGEIQLRKKAAEQCLTHRLDAQLGAIRAGLWEVLGRGTVRALTHEDLELLVCGDPAPSFQQVQESITCNLPSPQREFFWEVLKELSPNEWSDFFYFASAQKRFPLPQKIVVQPSGQSDAHMPVASTCFSQVTMPLYRSVAVMRAKLKQAIGCKDMELA